MRAVYCWRVRTGRPATQSARSIDRNARLRGVGGGWAPTSWRRRRGRSAMDVRRRARGVWTTRSILPRRPRLVQFPGVRGVTALVWVGVPDNEPEGAVEVCVGSVPGQLQGDAVQGGNAAKHNGEETPHRLLLRARHGGVRGGRRRSWLRTTRWAKYLVRSRGHRALEPVFTTFVCTSACYVARIREQTCDVHAILGRREPRSKTKCLKAKIQLGAHLQAQESGF